MSKILSLDNRLDILVQALKGKEALYKRIEANKSNFIYSFLRHVAENVPYYSSYEFEDNSLQLDKFHIITKELIISKYSQFLSSQFKRESLVEYSTSGTTGTLLKVSRDKASWYFFTYYSFRQIQTDMLNNLDSFKTGQLGVLQVNDNPNTSHFSIINPSLNYSFWKKIFVSGNNSFDKETISSLSNYTVPLLYGRPRTLLEFAKQQELLIGKNSMQVLTILTSGDNLYPDQRQKLESWFQSKVYNAYVSQEGGFMGIECSYKSGIHIFPNRAIIEILTSKNELLKEGKGEIIVTNLENWSMPFIRYQTGDMGTVKEVYCKCGFHGMSLIEMKGRDSEYFVIGNKKVNPTVIKDIFENLPIKQYQIKQISKDHFIISYIPSTDSINQEQLEIKIKKEVSNIWQSIGKHSLKITMEQNKFDKIPRYISNYKIDDINQL